MMHLSGDFHRGTNSVGFGLCGEITATSHIEIIIVQVTATTTRNACVCNDVTEYLNIAG